MSTTRRVHLLLAVGLTLTVVRAASSAAAPTTRPLPDVVDDSVFLEGLRQRGLHEWLRQYGQDAASSDDVAAALARREMLLDQATAPGQSVQQVRAAVRQAGEVLARLISAHRDHPGRYRWQLELARDCLERQRPEIFEHLLLYELPGPDVAAARELSGRAVEVLAGLRQEVAAAWKSVESLDEPPLATLRSSGSLTVLESLDAQSAMALTWARLYQALADRLTTEPEDAGRQAPRPGLGTDAAGGTGSKFTEVLAEVTNSGRLDLPPGREAEQAGALLIAAIAERYVGQTAEADAHARQVIALLDRTKDGATRQRLRQTILLAVLEQIRAARDSGHYDTALTSAAQARQWCLKSRGDDPRALVAVGLLESHVSYCRQLAAEARVASPSGRPDLRTSLCDWFRSADCLARLDRVARQSPAHRDLLYSVLASPLADTRRLVGVAASTLPASAPNPVARELVLGAAVAAAGAGGVKSASTARLEASIKSARDTLAQAELADDPQTAGEIRYLLGQAFVLQEARTEAIQILADLAEVIPMHDRADRAARQAVGLATEDVRRSGSSGSPASRAAFVRAARALRQRSPGDAGVPELTFSIGVAVETDGRYEDAAREYATVPIGHPRWRDAALGRLRCSRETLEQAALKGTRDATTMATLINDARTAARAVREQASLSVPTSAPGHASDTAADCGQGRLLLALAELLNEPGIDGAHEAAGLLDGFEKRFAACSDLVGPALWQRIVALRQLKRLDEARAVLDRYMTADSDKAGPTIMSLFKAVHDEMREALRRGDKPSASKFAAEAISLAETLFRWAGARPGRITPADLLVGRLWYASALLLADRPADSLGVLERAERQGQPVLFSKSGVRIELQLARADALFALAKDKEAFKEALSIYAEVFPQTAETSDSWWHALAGNLLCHARLDPDTTQVLQSIRQQRFLFPDLDGGRFKHDLLELEQSLLRPAGQPR